MKTPSILGCFLRGSLVLLCIHDRRVQVVFSLFLSDIVGGSSFAHFSKICIDCYF